VQDMSKVPFVEVVWHDAADHSGAWVDYDQAIKFASKPMRIVSRGWLIHKGKGYTVLSADYIDYDGYSEEENKDRPRVLSRVTKIPTPWIQRISEIVVATRKRSRR